MAYILDTTPITDQAQMPLKKGMIDFLQQAHMTSLGALITGLLGPATVTNPMYVLYGEFSATPYSGGTTYSINANSGQPAAVFYQGEVFYVWPAGPVNVATTSGQTMVARIITGQYNTNADPVQFTDGNSYNVCNIRSIAFSAAAPGSGIANWSNLVIQPLVLATEQANRIGAVSTLQNEINVLQGQVGSVTGNSLQTQINTINAGWQDFLLNSTNVLPFPNNTTLTGISGNLRYKITPDNTIYGLLNLGVTVPSNAQISYIQVMLPQNRSFNPNGNNVFTMVYYDGSVFDPKGVGMLTGNVGNSYVQLGYTTGPGGNLATGGVDFMGQFFGELAP